MERLLSRGRSPTLQCSRNAEDRGKIWMCGIPPQCGFQGTFFHVLQCCGMTFLVQCFQADTTRETGNALVIPLVLQENTGGGDHLTPGHPYARLALSCRAKWRAPGVPFAPLSPQEKDTIPTIWMCGPPPQCSFQGTFFNEQQSCEMSFLLLCYWNDTTWSGKTPVIPLVLLENMSSGDPYARLSSFFIKKKYYNIIL
ncbi:unnamed protein product [Leptidea sinapis]|uniref:Uncharacterized protein n=1 Tax=Leptidea sinapis TaxID=189913 RepID=A0A5E4Q6N9_9NEOP|nr:unnamed protein product [Leptidea sinapis]